MIYAAYQFPDVATANAALAQDVTVNDASDVIGDRTILVDEAPVTTGYYVNAVWGSEEPSSWIQYRIPTADAPRWWAGVAREVTAPTPIPVRKLTSLQFMDRLSSQRQTEIVAAAIQVPALLLSLLRLSGATEVDLDNPETVAVVAAMVSASLISQAEADVLLT